MSVVSCYIGIAERKNSYINVLIIREFTELCLFHVILEANIPKTKVSSL